MRPFFFFLHHFPVFDCSHEYSKPAMKRQGKNRFFANKNLSCLLYDRAFFFYIKKGVSKITWEIGELHIFLWFSYFLLSVLWGVFFLSDVL